MTYTVYYLSWWISWPLWHDWSLQARAWAAALLCTELSGSKTGESTQCNPHRLKNWKSSKSQYSRALKYMVIQLRLPSPGSGKVVIASLYHACCPIWMRPLTRSGLCVVFIYAYIHACKPSACLIRWTMATDMPSSSKNFMQPQYTFLQTTGLTENLTVLFP